MKHRSTVFVAAMSVIALAYLAAASLRAEDWPQFRGPTGMGQTAETRLPLQWGGDDGKNVLWKAPLPATLAKGKPDHNQSSPIVWRDRLFVTSAFWPEKRPQSDYPDQHVMPRFFPTSAPWPTHLLWDIMVKLVGRSRHMP